MNFNAVQCMFCSKQNKSLPKYTNTKWQNGSIKLSVYFGGHDDESALRLFFNAGRFEELLQI